MDNIFNEYLCSDDELISNVDKSYNRLLNNYKGLINEYTDYKNTLNPMYIENIKNIHNEFFIFEDGTEPAEAQSSEEQGLANLGKAAQSAAVETGSGIIKFITWIIEKIGAISTWLFKTSVKLLNVTSAQVNRWTGRITLNLDISDLKLYLQTILPNMRIFCIKASECLDVNKYRTKDGSSFNGEAFKKDVYALDPFYNKFNNLKINGTTIDFREGKEKFFYLFPYVRYPKGITDEKNRLNYNAAMDEYGRVEFEMVRDANGNMNFKYQLPKSITDEEKQNISKIADDFIQMSDIGDGRSLKTHLSYMELLQYTLNRVRSYLNIFNSLKEKFNNIKMNTDFRGWVESSGFKVVFEKLKHMIFDAVAKLSGFISVESKDAQTITSTMKTILQEENRAIEKKESEKIENNEKTDHSDPNDANALA